MSFKKFYEAELSIQESLMTLYYVTNSNTLNESSELNESILDDFAGQVKAALPKFGVKIHKGSGLIDYLKKFTTVGGKILVAALQKDKEKIKELAKNVERAEFVDFLLKLDMVTMHLITGPIHMIDAVTGWDLMANLKAHAKKAENTIEDIKHAIEELKAKIKKIADESIASKIASFFDSIGDFLYGNIKMDESLNEAVKVKVWMKSIDASAYGLGDIVRLNNDDNVVFFNDISINAGFFRNTEVNFSAPKDKIGFYSLYTNNGDYGRKPNAKKELFDYINTKPKLILKALKKLVKGSPTKLVGDFYVTTADYSSGAYQGNHEKYLLAEKFDISDSKKLIKYLTNYGWNSVTYLSIIVYLDGEYTKIESDYSKASAKGLDFNNLSDIINEILLSLNKTENELEKYGIFLNKNITQNKIEVTVNNFSLTSRTTVKERRIIPFDITKAKLKTEIKKFLNDIKEYDKQVSGAASSFRSHIKATGGHNGNPVYMD